MESLEVPWEADWCCEGGKRQERWLLGAELGWLFFLSLARRERKFWRESHVTFSLFPLPFFPGFSFPNREEGIRFFLFVFSPTTLLTSSPSNGDARRKLPRRSG